MSFDFTVKEFILGNGTGTFTFYRRGFNLNGGGSSPEWQDIILSGNTALTLVNAKANGLNYLKLFGGTELLPETYLDTVTLSGGCEQRNLPEGYTQLEFLQSDGACYIDLLRVPNNDDIIEQKFQKMGTSTTTCAWYGSMPSSQTILPRIGIGTFQNQVNLKLTFFAGSNYTGPISEVDTNVHTLRFQATGRQELTYTFDGVTDVIDASTGTVSPDMYEPAIELTSYLFARHGTNGVQVYDNEGTKIYYHREYLANGTLALNVVPAKRNSDNVLGMYDLVSGQFLTNQGTGSFVAGSTAVPSPDTPMNIVCNNGAIKARHQSGLPLGYTLLDYVVFDGTQVLDTGFVPNNNSRIESKCYRTTNDDCWFYGASPNNPRVTLYHSRTGTCRWGYQSISNIGLVADTEYTLIQDKNGISINGVHNPWTGTADDFTCDRSLTIGNCNGSTGTRYFAGNFYYMKIYDNNVLARDYLPVKRNSDNALGVYDRVNGTFLTASDFVTGTAVSDTIVIYTDGTVETVTDSNGLTATAQMLLSVGDYKDTQEVLSGAVTRNIGILILDGTESWLVATGTGYRQFYVTSTQGIIAGSVSLVSNIAPYGCTASTRTQYNFGCYSGSTGNLCFQMIGSSTLTTTEQFQQYLADQYTNRTPVIVVYPLATATTESVTGQFLSKSPVTQTAGAISGLTINSTSSSHTTPTPQQPLPINCNNGVLKLSPNLFNKDQTPYQSGYYVANTTVVGSNIVTMQNSNYNIYKIEVRPNITYTFGKIKATNPAWAVVDSNDIVLQTGINDGGTDGRDVTITTGATAKYLYLSVAVDGTYKCDDILQLELGSVATTYRPYGQIYVDGTTETVEVTGKNLFDKNAVSTVAPNTLRSDFIRVVPGVVYSMSTRGASVIIEYDSEQTQLRTLYIGATTYTPSADAVFAKFNLMDTYLNTFQVELGSTATTYEPYFNGGSATAEMLLKVGAYQDVQSVLDGEVSRNVVVKVLDGTENWVESNTYQGSCWLNLPINSQQHICLCTHFDNASSLSSYARGKVYNEGYAINLWYGNNKTTAVAEFKAFLAQQYANGTPVILLRALKTPTTETVTVQPLNIQAGTNIVEITQASMDNLELEVSYKGTV